MLILKGQMDGLEQKIQLDCRQSSSTKENVVFFENGVSVVNMGCSDVGSDRQP